MPHLHGAPKGPVHLCVISTPCAAGLKVTGSPHQLGDSPLLPCSALQSGMRSKVRSQSGGPSIPGTLLLLSPLQELLSCREADGWGHSVIHSTDTHQMLFYVSHWSSLWGQARDKTHKIPDLWGLYSSEETNVRPTVIQINV